MPRGIYERKLQTKTAHEVLMQRELKLIDQIDQLLLDYDKALDAKQVTPEQRHHALLRLQATLSN